MFPFSLLPGGPGRYVAQPILIRTSMPTLVETAAEIEMVIASWRPKLRGLDSDTVHARPAPERWSISEVIGHLVDSACNNHQRFVRAQRCTELVFPKYEQNEWVTAANYRTCNWESLIDLWYHYNRLIANMIRNIPESQLSTPCTITPYETCTLEFLVTEYLKHLHHHFRILDDRIANKTSATEPVGFDVASDEPKIKP